MNELDASLGSPRPTNFRDADAVDRTGLRRDHAVLRLLTFLRERGKAIRHTAVAVGTTLLAIVVGIGACQFYEDRRLGWIELTNDGAPLVAQVLPEAGDGPLGEQFHVTTRSTLALPAGDYRLRVHGEGRLGRTYRFAVNQGETQTHALSLDEGRLLGGEPVPRMPAQEKPREVLIPFAPTTVALELTPGKSDLIEWTGQTVIRRDGQTGKPVWDSSQALIPLKTDEGSAGRLREGLELAGTTLNLIQPAPDLDGDGAGDLVWFSRNMTSLLALSGASGSVLWDFALELDEPGITPPDDPRLLGPVSPARRPVSLVDAPVVADLDQDGTLDLVATMVFFELPIEIERRSPSPPGVPGQAAPNRQTLARRVIQGISGRAGRTLWSHPIDSTFTTYSHPVWSRPATIVTGRKRAMVTHVDGEKWVGLEPATGKPIGLPIDLGFVPVRPVQYGDLDGDGEPEVLALGPGQSANQQSLAAFSLGTGRNLWVAAVNAQYVSQVDQPNALDWPVVVDLDGDGRCELVGPDAGAMALAGGYGGVRVLDGFTGQTRWIRPMRPETKGDDGLVRILDAPDLDHDGVRDLITTSLFLGRYPTTNHNGTPPIPERVYVDALSGKDGHPLWWWHRDLATDWAFASRTPRWWSRGPDGWPLLAVRFGGQNPQFAFISAGPLIVHNLEASTGRAVSTVVGLNRVGAADLDGDGLTDLWGEADGQLRAFRGEAPEVWRALGSFAAAREFSRWATNVVRPAADLDGDGIADTLIAGPRAADQSALDAIASHALEPSLDQGFPQPSAGTSVLPGSRTVVARSGRDGHAIWKTELDRRRVWYERDHGEYYSLTIQSLPAGDLDGDGTPDVLVQRYANQLGALESRQPATLPLQVLSGRTGQRLWSAGPLPLGFEAHGYSAIQWVSARVVLPRGAPDIIVQHGSPFVPSRPLATPAGGANKPRLARISGRDGQILWDIPLSEQQDPNNAGSAPAPGFADLDGDGALDVVVALPGWTGSARPDHELRAVSLRDGRLLWSLRLEFKNSFTTSPQLAVADLDGDKRSEVVVTEHPAAGEQAAFVLKALDGRDGAVRWTWNGGAPENPQSQVYGWLSLANFGGDGRQTVCLRFLDPKARNCILVIDEQGLVRASRDLAQYGGVCAADVNGDGCDELLVQDGADLHVWSRDLKELWSRPIQGNGNEQVLQAASGQPGMIIVPPALGLDGCDGRPRWAGHSPKNWSGSVFTTNLLDQGDSARLPRFLTTGLGATVRRSALPTTPAGAYAPPQGVPVQPGLARDDPRWTRPQPWAHAVDNEAAGSGVLAVIILALFNVYLPLGILRQAARRRPWTLRLMMALPVAAAVPLTAFVAIEPLIPALPAPYPSSSRVLFGLGSLVGLPIVSFAAVTGWSVLRRRWRRLALLAALTGLVSLAIGMAWLRIDIRSMPAIEHYAWTGWYLAVLPGAYGVGVLILLAWLARGLLRLPRRPRPAARAAAPAEVV
jgi:PQQ-like domain